MLRSVCLSLIYVVILLREIYYTVEGRMDAAGPKFIWAGPRRWPFVTLRCQLERHATVDRQTVQVTK